MARRWTLARVYRGLEWRLAIRVALNVFRAGPWDEDVEPPAPPGHTLFRLSAAGGEVEAGLLEPVMAQASGDPRTLPARLAHGDECFGWLRDGQVVCLGWTTPRDRVVGPIRLRDSHGRAFLYDFFTVPEARGQGLYPALLLQMRRHLGRAGATEFIIEVDLRNAVSLRGVEKAGFRPVGKMAYLILLRRWEWPLGCKMLDDSVPALFF